MAGHSKWANIKHRKAAKDAQKGKLYAQAAREIMMAAKLGGGDPAGNFRLRTALDRAKSAGLPNENIQRAIDKGTGKLESDNLASVVYEGYGPEGVAIFIETLTDNRNRTVGDIRSYFNKCQGNLGSDGCVAWIFEEKGLVLLNMAGLLESEAFDKSVEAGCSDFLTQAEEGIYEVFTDPPMLNTVCTALKSKGLEIASAELTRVPENTVIVNDISTAKILLKLLDLIESQEDVQAVYSNADFPEPILEALDA